MNRTWTLALLGGLAATSSVAGEARLDFNRDIRSLISNHCVACHGPDEEERKAGLRLDTFEGATADLGGHAAIVPGKPEASEMLHRLLSEDEDEVMPPPGKGPRFSPEQVERIRRWIAEGANYQRHWSYEAPQTLALPAVADPAWPLGAIDHFILARLEQEGLSPSPEADRRTLARRLSLDLVGLPPDWDEVEAFVADERPDAYERYVASLLAKPAFGEHWASLWLDLARYADSSGYPSDQPREIWAYRDWLLQALNRNLPFDQFTIEQIAGDLLPEPSEDQLIATAFHRNTMTQNEGGTSDEEFRIAAVVDRVNTTFSVWMGTTMACAQCHSHKYDPITQHEYFQVFAIFNQSADADRKDEAPLHSFYTKEQKARRDRLEAEIRSLEEQLAKPDPAWLQGYESWLAQYPRDLAWQRANPDKALCEAAGGAAIGDEGVVSIAAPVESAVHEVELPLEGSRLRAIRVETEPAPGFGNFVLTGVQAELLPPPDAPQPRARYVRIDLPGKGKILQLAEVEVFSEGTNLASQGRASQSSQYADAAASRAQDGRTDGDYAKGSVAHTDTQDDPWWELDLGAEQPIDRLVVWNRTDHQLGSRLEGFRLSLLDAKRQTVWTREGLPAPKTQGAYGIGGPEVLRFTHATADYEQEGFPAASLLQSGPEAKGWAVAGATDRSHQLVLMLQASQTVLPGSRLRLRLEQKSPYPKHVIGRFRLATTGDERVARVLAIPASLRVALDKLPAERSEAEQKALTDYYLRTQAPETAPLRQRLAASQKELAAIRPATVPIMQELPQDQRRETRVQIRGNWQNLGDRVEPGVPAAFHPFPAALPRNRLGLARWLVSRDNPLTARVLVNRYWEAIFGSGLVQTSEEFGSQGEMPSHPELLDWLAVDFMEQGWDLKRLLTQLVCSRTYRQISRVTPDRQERDPDNRLLSRGPRFRPSGELLRDQALAVGGILSPKFGGPSVRPMAPSSGLNTAFGRSNDWTTSPGEDRHRRSVYTEVRRNAPYASFTTFDAPNREVCTIRRNRTNTPLQAFVTLNDPVYVEAAQAFARRLLAELPGGEAGERIRRAYQLALARDPDESELSTLTHLQKEALASFQSDLAAATLLATQPLGPAPGGADLAELAAWTAATNVILNLDEFLMRP